MCVPVLCRSCRKFTWSGCGRHASDVLAAIPESQRCGCREG